MKESEEINKLIQALGYIEKHERGFYHTQHDQLTAFRALKKLLREVIKSLGKRSEEKIKEDNKIQTRITSIESSYLSRLDEINNLQHRLDMLERIRIPLIEKNISEIKNVEKSKE